MNQYLYEVSYTSPKTEEKRHCVHLLITAESDALCYLLALKAIEKEHLSELDKSVKKILNTETASEFDIENLLRDENASRSYLFHTIQHSKRYFLEESALLECRIDGEC
jgi:hypothetical protein